MRLGPPDQLTRSGRSYIAVDLLLSADAVNAMAASPGDEAQCGEDAGGCGGTHTDCYFRGKMVAALRAVGVAATGTGDDQ